MKNSLPLLHRARRAVLAACIVLWVGEAVATHLPAERVPGLGISDPTLHFTGYFALAGMFLAVLIAHRVPRIRRILLTIAVMTAYGAADELTQEFVAGRQADVYDWLADVLGTLAAVIVFEVILHILIERRGRATRT